MPFLTIKSTDPNEAEIAEVLQSLAPQLTEEAIQIMSQPFTDQEVKDAISCMSPLKFQGPDGYPALFFHKYWHILVSNVIDFMLNYINIILILKLKNLRE